MPRQTPLSQLKAVLASNDDVSRRAVTITELARRLPDSAIDLLTGRSMAPTHCFKLPSWTPTLR